MYQFSGYIILAPSELYNNGNEFESKMLQILSATIYISIILKVCLVIIVIPKTEQL